MIQDENIEIPLSKKKLLLLLIGSIVFVLLGVWFLVKPPSTSNPIFGNPALIFVVGLVSVIFFGFGVITIFRKISDKKPGLIISRQGIIDNSSGVSAGLIPWTDIVEIKVSQVMNQKFLMFVVHNPEVYLEKVKNPIKRNLMKMNHKNFGSPISISSNALKTNFDDLQKLLHDKMNEYNS